MNNLLPDLKLVGVSQLRPNLCIYLQVFEGERSMTKDCRLLGKFDLNGIPAAPRFVIFEIRVNESNVRCNMTVGLIMCLN
jgi:hypothetical protein